MGGGCCIGDFCCVVDLGCGFCCIAEISCSDCCVGYSSAPSDSSDHAKDVAEELAAMRQRADEEARREETDVLNKMDVSIAAFLREVEEYNRRSYGGRQLNIDIKAIKEKNSKLKEDISGFIGEKLSNRLVPTDKFLSLILDGRNKENRKQKFEDFYQDIMKEAREDLVERIKETGNEQLAMIEDAINQRLDEVDESMGEAEHRLRELLKAREESERKVADEKADLQYRLELCRITLDEVEEARKI